MAKKYKNSWNCQKLNVNFTQKQWRQDFAAYVREKLFWDIAMVTRSTIVITSPKEKIKEFIVYNNIGQNFNVKFRNEKEIISCSNLEIVENYLKERSVFN